MYRIVTIALSVFICCSGIQQASAQLNQQEITIMQTLFGMDKRAMAVQAMKLSAPDSIAFWPLFDKYEMQRSELSKRRIDLAQGFAQRFPNMSHAEIDAMIDAMDDAEDDLRDLIMDYYDEIKERSSAQTAAMFYEFETYINNAVAIHLQQGVSLVAQFPVKPKP